MGLFRAPTRDQYQMRSTLILAAIGAAFHCLPAHAQKLPQLQFQHHDWELACDNTRTCRAAGYHAEVGDYLPVSVLLERKAGAGEPITATLQLGETRDDAPAADSLLMLVEGREVGDVVLEGGSGVLSSRQTAALLKGISGTAKVAWRAHGQIWILSGKGASAVLLKMDEFQGRLDTPGAAIRKGGRTERGVLPPLAKPVVDVPAVPTGELPPLAGEEKRLLLATLRKTGGSEDCGDLEAIATGEEEFHYAPLDGKRMLVSARCWRGAYNEGHGYWVVNRKPPFAPTMVTESGTDYAQGFIGASHKGRGIGDCWGSNGWAWDGRRFVHTDAATTGMCREIAAGGAWNLPTLVSEVRQAGK